MQEMPDLRGEGKSVKYPKMIIDHCYSLREIAEEIARGTTYGVGEIEGLVETIARVMAEKMAWGNSVRLDGIGIFSPKLALKPEVAREGEDGRRRNAASLMVGGINFRADKRLVYRCDKACTPSRTQTKRYAKRRDDRAGRVGRLLEHLRSEGFITIRAYAALTQLERTSAGAELRELAKEGVVSAQGRGSHLLYILPKQ